MIDLSVCQNLMNNLSFSLIISMKGYVKLRVRDPVTWLCVESHIVGRPLFDFKHCSIKPSDRCCRHVYILVWERPCVFSPGVCRNVARLPVGLLPGWHGTVALVGVLESGRGDWSRGGRVLVVTGQYPSVEISFCTLATAHRLRCCVMSWDEFCSEFETLWLDFVLRVT